MRKNLLKMLIGILFVMNVVERRRQNDSKSSNEQEGKMEQYYHILNQWLDLRQGNITLYSYFDKRGYKKIGIYGMRELGQRLYYELKDTDVKLYLIDKAADRICFEEDIVAPSDGIPEADVIVVTAAYHFESIQKKLKEIVKCPVVSIQEIVNEF